MIAIVVDAAVVGLVLLWFGAFVYVGANLGRWSDADAEEEERRGRLG